MSQETFVPAGEGAPKKSHGCLWGCLGATVALIVVLVAGVFVVKHAIERTIDAVTETEAMAIPAVEVAPDEAEALVARLGAFGQALRNGQPAEPLVLTEDEVNVAIQSHPDWAMLKGRIHVTLSGDEAGGKISMPLGEMGLGFLEGRYLNASAKFNVFFQAGVLHVYVVSGEVKGKPLPESVLQRLRTENLAKDMQTDSETRAMLEKLASVEVKDGKLIITPKAASERAASPNSPTAGS